MSENDSTIPSGFRQIPGFPRYAISEDGVILSVCRYGKCRPSRLWSEARRISTRSKRCGYPAVVIWNDNGIRQACVHTIVLETYVGPCPDGYECRHLDGCRTNNHVSNLAWGTRADNHRDQIRHGTTTKGEMNCNAKLTADDVIEIRRRRSNGEPLRVLVDDFNVTKSNISGIANRRTWKHI